MFFKDLSRVDRLVLNKYYTKFFNFCVFVDFIHFSTYLSDIGRKRTREVEFYFERLHPLYIIVLIMHLPKLLIPILGFFWYLDSIVNMPDEKTPCKDSIPMSRKGDLKRQLRALRKEYGPDAVLGINGIMDFDESENTKSTRRAGKRNRKQRGAIQGTIWDDDAWKEYYEKKYGISFDDSTSMLDTKSPNTLERWNESKIDESIEDPVPEEEARVENLYMALNNGYIKSVEKYFKQKCNIYRTDFGYALERINREKSEIYLDIDFDYVKIWEGEDKVELLKSLIGELEKGFIQPVIKDLLLNILDRYDVDITKIPENKQGLLQKEYKVCSIPEDLKLLKAKNG